MLRFDHVTKSYGALAALDRLDLEIEPGRTTVLIGPSGCGKSTVLRLMIGLQQPDTGTITFGDEPLEPARLPTLRQRMGYVIQDGGLFPHLSARANATLVARHLRWEPARMETRLDELAALTHFPLEALDRYPAELSGGQQQRVSLMRALMLDPQVLLLDEPLGALDPMIRFELQAELREIFERLGKTVVLVTHDLGEAAFFADRIVLLRAGRIVQSGPARALLESPADDFVRRFVKAQRSPLDALEGRT